MSEISRGVFTDMKIRTFGYYIKQGVRSAVNNRVMSLASIATVAASLFIFGLFTILVINVDNVVNSVQNKIEIKAFLKNDVTTIKQREIKREIEKISGVKEMKYESKEDALENYIKQLGENKDLAKGLDKDNPLPASYIIKVEKPSDVAFVSKEIKLLDGIEKVNDGQEIVDQVIRITKFIKGSSMVLMIILGIIAVFLIENTIKLTVYARKKEIGIMKYIGATDWFIKWPFIIEGVLLGFIGGIVAIGLLYYGYGYVANFVSKDIVILSLVSGDSIIGKLIWQFSLVGMFIGGTGSLMSLRKFLVV